MEDTGRVEIDLGECNLKVTRLDGECSEILVSNPGKINNCNKTFQTRSQDFAWRVGGGVRMSENGGDLNFEKWVIRDGISCVLKTVC